MADVGAQVLVGTRVEITATFTKAGEVTPSNPTTVTCVVSPPAPDADFTLIPGVAAGFTNPSPGVFKLIHIPSTAGRWWYSFRGVTPGVAGPTVPIETQVNVISRVVP